MVVGRSGFKVFIFSVWITSLKAISLSVRLFSLRGSSRHVVASCKVLLLPLDVGRLFLSHYLSPSDFFCSTSKLPDKPDKKSLQSPFSIELSENTFPRLFSLMQELAHLFLHSDPQVVAVRSSAGVCVHQIC